MDHVKIYFYLAVLYTGTTFKLKFLFPLLSIGYVLTKITEILQLIDIVVNYNFKKKFGLRKERKSG